MSATPGGPDEDGFVQVARIPASSLPGTRMIAGFAAPSEVIGLAQRMRFLDGPEREECTRRAPFLSGAPYALPGSALFELPDIRLLHHPRMEGMCFTGRDEMVRETRGSPRTPGGDGYLRWERGEGWLKRGLEPTGEIALGAVCYDSASRNFAHFMMIMLPRVMLVDHAVGGVPILLPDLPGYAASDGASIPNELLHRMADIYPLSNGNFYAPLRNGVWLLRRALIPSIGASRWDFVLHPVVRAGFARIAKEAVRRRAVLAGKAEPLPRRVYISRQGASRRRVTNHEEVEALLAARGFVTLRLETLDFFTQAALFAEAEAVVAPHGAGLANLLFNDGRAGVVELYAEGDPQYHFALCAAAVGCRYLPLAGARTSNYGDVRVDAERLSRALDAVQG